MTGVLAFLVCLAAGACCGAMSGLLATGRVRPGPLSVGGPLALVAGVCWAVAR